MAVPPPVIFAALSLARQYLPTLIGRIGGGNSEEVAETIVDTATSLVGLPKDATIKTILEKLSNDTEAEAALRLSLEKMEQELLLAEFEDRQNARESQAQRGTQRGNWMLAGVTIGLLGCILAVWLGDFSSSGAGPGALALLTTIAGALLKMFSDAFAFEFGSSRGSKEKDAQISDFKSAMLSLGRETARTARTAAGGQTKNADMNENPQVGGTRSSDKPSVRDFVGALRSGKI